MLADHCKPQSIRNLPSTTHALARRVRLAWETLRAGPRVRTGPFVSRDACYAGSFSFWPTSSFVVRSLFVLRSDSTLTS